MSEADDFRGRAMEWREDTLREMRRYNSIKEALWFGTWDDYIAAAEIYIKEYIPEKAVRHFLPPDKAFTKDDYADILWEIIRQYKSICSYRYTVKQGYDRDDPKCKEAIRRGEEIGF